MDTTRAHTGGSAYSQSPADPLAFWIEIKDDGHTLIVAPHGELDQTTTPRLAAGFKGRSDAHHVLACDMTGVTFMDSTALFALVRLAELEPQRFALAGTSWPVERLLYLTCTDDRFRRVSL